MNQELLLEIAKKYGTPTYVYDSSIIERQYNRMVKAFDKVENLRINYACKALSNINILHFFVKLGSGLDVVSLEELFLGLKAGFSPDKIIYTPNGISLTEIEEAMKQGVQINIDNLSVLEQFGNKYPKVPICIRINPHIMAGGNRKISVGHIDSKFGISIYQLRNIERIVKNTGMKINGIHMHTGSDILDIEAFMRATEILFDTVSHFDEIDFIDLGSGFKISYYEGDVSTNIESIGKILSERFNKFIKSKGRKITLMFEPGKYLVSESGRFLVGVNVIKYTPSMVFAGVNSGFNHFPRPMMYDSYHKISNISNLNGKKRYYTVVGYICETDTFAADRLIEEINEDDILCFDNAGAYCSSMSSNYNSRLKPAEVLIHKNKHYLIKERETMDNFLMANKLLEI